MSNPYWVIPTLVPIAADVDRLLDIAACLWNPDDPAEFSEYARGQMELIADFANFGDTEVDTDERKALIEAEIRRRMKGLQS